MTDAPAPVGANAGAAAAVAPAQSPPRINVLTLCNFRGFPGPAPVPIELNGKNAVIFGENGSGKSSIFQALDGFFSVSEPNPATRRARLLGAVNLFADGGLDGTWLEVEWDDGAKDRWSKDGHPCDVVWGAGVSSRAFEAAYRKAIFDYHLLLETNFRHSAGAINLFDICVSAVLRDYRTAHDGSEETIWNLWSELVTHISPPRKPRRDSAKREKYRLSFNNGLAEALEALVPTINAMLQEMGWQDVALDRFDFPLLYYNNEWQLRLRGFNGTQVTPVLKFNGEELDNPHLFLNEARLSALALAIYFAGRKLCAETVLAGTPKIMVLDDVVIGLDQSNRLPVLDLLATHFKQWQIVLLTYDRFWFDMTRSYHRRHVADKFWEYWELHPSDNVMSPPTPLRVSSSSARQSLDLAASFLGAGHINAAGNAVRVACERALREFCEVKRAPVRYRVDGEKIPFSDLLAGAKEWSRKNADSVYDDVLSDIDMYSSLVLNRLSHGGTSSLTKYEVHGAIVAVRAVLLALKVVSKNEP